MVRWRWLLLVLACGAVGLGQTADVLPPVLIADWQVVEPGPGWPGWPRSLGTAASACDVEVVAEGPQHWGRLGAERASGVVMLPLPDLTLTGRPTELGLRLATDIEGLRLSMTLTDARGVWWTTASQELAAGAWHAVQHNLLTATAPLAQPPPEAPLAPLTPWTLNLEFTQPGTGAINLDDLHLRQVPYAGLDYVEIGLIDISRTLLVWGDERPPALALANRGDSDLNVRVTGQVAGLAFDRGVRAAPRSQTRVDLPTDLPSGPLEIEATVAAEGQSRATSHEFLRLPPTRGGPDDHWLVGAYSLDDVLEGRFLAELLDVRSLSARWTLLELRRRGEPAPLREEQWLQVEVALTTAEAFGLRCLAQVSPAALLEPGRDQGVATVGLARLGPDLGGVLLLDGSDAPPVDVAAAAEAAVGLAPDVGLWLGAPLVQSPLLTARLLEVPARWRVPPGPFPQAWRALADLLPTAGDGQPVWALAPGWLGAAPSGLDDPVAAAAVTALAAHGLPGLDLWGWRSLRALDGGAGLAPVTGQLSEPLAAWAVAARLLAGLESSLPREIAPDLWEQVASGPRRLRAIWSEAAGDGLALAVDAEPGETVYDSLGRQLGAGPHPISARPLYFERASLLGPAVDDAPAELPAD